MPLSRPFPANHRHDGFPLFRWWRAGRDRGTEREPLSVLPFGHAVQVSTPRVHFYTFISIGRMIWFLALVANGVTSPPKPKLPRPVSPWGDHAIPFRAAWAGRRIYAGFGTIGAFQSQHVFPRGSVHIERGIRVPDSVASRVFDKWVPSTVADATCCSFGGQASPEDARMGRRINGFRPVLVLVPAAAAASTLIGADTPRSCSRREGAIDPRLQLHRAIDVTLSSNQPAPGCWPRRTPNVCAGCFPAGVSVPCRTFA